MKWGFDIDGVLTNFVRSYQNLTITTTQRNLFAPGDETNPPCWDWPQHRGYTAEEMKAVWQKITTSSSFWVGLRPLNGASTLKLVLPELLRRGHDIYYCTSRLGIDAKWQSELWCQVHLEHELPTVLITDQKNPAAQGKGLAALLLGFDVYVDDNLDNANSVALMSPQTRCYLLNYTYNQGDTDASIIRINKLGELFDRELENI